MKILFRVGVTQMFVWGASAQMTTITGTITDPAGDLRPAGPGHHREKPADRSFAAPLLPPVSLSSQDALNSCDTRMEPVPIPTPDCFIQTHSSWPT